MHVMFIPSWYHNSRNKVHGSFFKEQALAIQNEGVKVTVAYNEIWPLTMLGKNKEKSGLNIEVEEGLNTYRYRNYNFIPKHHKMFKLFNRRMDRLYKEVLKREGKVDVIHAQSSLWAGISAAYIAEKYNIPLIITEHSSIKHSEYVKGSYESYIKESYKIANKLIVVGNGIKKEVEDFSGRKDVEVIHNLAELDLFNINNENINNEFVFFSLAFLEGGKGMDTLIKSFAKSFKYENCRLKIGGDGSQKESLIQLVKDLGVEDKVDFLGALLREQVAEQMGECDAFVLASRYETFGVVYIEALASGKPIIGTYNGGAEDIINNRNGLIVQVDDIDGLAKAMEKIKKDIKSYNKLEIRKECEDRFGKAIIANEIINKYIEVVNLEKGDKVVI